MNENPTFSSEMAVGDKLAEFKRGELIDFAIKVCEALDEVSDGKFRGGIRPNNIMLADDKVILGPAAAMGSTGWSRDELEYLAPELFWNGKGSVRSDVYSVGLILYCGCNGGRLPFVPVNVDEVPDSRPNALKTRMNGEPVMAPWGAGKKLKAIIEKATAFKEMERYFDASELAKALMDYLEAVPVDASKTAMEVFGKPVDELSVIERMMVDIIHSSLVDDDIEEPPQEEEPTAEPMCEEEVPTAKPEETESEPETEQPEEAAAEEVEPEPEKVPAVEEAPVPVEVKKQPEAEKKAKAPAAKKPREVSSAHKPAVEYPSPNAKKAKPQQKKKKKKKKKNSGGKAVPIVLAVLVIIGVAVYAFWDELPFNAEPTPTPSPDVTPTESVTPSLEPSPSPEPSVEPSAPVKQGYEIIVADVSWDEAELDCVARGGHLVTINTREEYATVCAMLRDYNVKYVWVGCYRDPAGLMTWTSGQDVDAYFWQEGEPSMTDSYDGAEENYVMLVRQSDDTWLYNDSRMDPLQNYAKYYTGKIAYICEYGN